MKLIHFVAGTSACSILLIAASCGGSGGGGTTGATGGGGGNCGNALSLEQKGNAIINAALAPNGTRTRAVFTTAVNDFTTAETCLGDTNSRIGLALSEVGLAGATAATDAGATIPGTARLANLSNIFQTYKAGSVSKVPAAFGSITPAVTTFNFNSLPTIQFDLGFLKPTLDLALNALSNDQVIQGLETNPLSYQNPVGSGTLKFGAAEGFALRAVLKSLEATIDLTSSYDVEVNNFNFNDSFETTFANTIASNGVITDESLWPPAPFFKLRPSGKANFQDIGTQAAGGLNDIISGVNVLKVRTATGFFANLAKYTQADLTTALSDAQVGQNYLTGQGNVAMKGNAGTVQVVMDIPHLLANPPSDLRPFFPDLQVAHVNGQVQLTVIVGSVQDPTFGGLFPNGIPDSVLYDRSPKTVDSTTTIGDVSGF